LVTVVTVVMEAVAEVDVGMEEMTLRTSPAPTPLTRARPQAIDISGGRNMLNTKLVSWALGIFAAITFWLCVIYGLVTPQSLHMHTFLEQVLPAFKWITWWGFLLGLVESFLYGVYAGLVFCPIYNLLNRRIGAGPSAA
jgi:2TM family of unknown function (DUF5676)